jgi:hypothetical protein
LKATLERDPTERSIIGSNDLFATQPLHAGTFGHDQDFTLIRPVSRMNFPFAGVTAVYAPVQK